MLVLVLASLSQHLQLPTIATAKHFEGFRRGNPISTAQVYLNLAECEQSAAKRKVPAPLKKSFRVAMQAKRL